MTPTFAGLYRTGIEKENLRLLAPPSNCSLQFFQSVAAEIPLQPMSSQPFHQWCFPDGRVWVTFFRNGDGYTLRFVELADFIVSGDGTRVNSYPALNTSASTIEHLYLNQVMPLALSLQGKLVLHASAVETSVGAIAFMGASGRGKSTLATAFAAAGFRFLTDDGLLLEKSEGGYKVQPSHPSIRLWDDSREALLLGKAMLAPPLQFTSKTRILSDDVLAFCDEARPLSSVYFLGDGSALELSIEPMRSSEALIGLLKHSFLLDIEARDMMASHFDKLTQLVKVPMCFNLDYPRCYADLPRVREAIIRHTSKAKANAKRYETV